MKKAIKAKWLKALRGGRYKQAHAILKDDDGAYCCLGVLCNVVGARWRLNDDKDHLVPFLKSERLEHEDEYYLSPEFSHRIGLDDTTQRLLAEMNDGNQVKGAPKRSFSEIADYIEKNL